MILTISLRIIIEQKRKANRGIYRDKVTFLNIIIQVNLSLFAEYILLMPTCRFFWNCHL